MKTSSGNHFDAAVEIKNVGDLLVTPRNVAGERRREATQSCRNAHELLGEIYTVLSLACLIGVLLYHVAM
jgi:hypothetical protein